MLRRFAIISFLVITLGACTTSVNNVQQNPVSVQAPQPAGEGEQAAVTRIIDGDTIDVLLAGTEYRVRYIGMNTPERDQPCYQAATDANSALVRGKTVTLFKDVSETDRYGRLLRYIYVGNTFVNAELVRMGYALSVHYPPDTSQATFLDQLQTQAAGNGYGCTTGVFGAMP